MPYIGNPQVGFISADTLAVSGTVDGRDVSVDGTKLDTIETSATADQTNAEIRAAIEAASDSNVFTDADHTKLNGIEASATADQTASEIRTLVESASDSNVFTDADHSKLNAIEASADVTDATNVAAAGALMTSGGTVTGDTAFTAHASIGVNAVNSARALTVAGATDGSSSTILQLYNSSLASKFSVRDDGFVDINGPVDMSSTLQVDGVLSTSSNLKSSSSSSGGFNALTISHASNTSGDESRIQFKRTTDAGSDREVAAIVADRVGGNDTALAFETNTDGSDGAVERVRIDQDGNMLVGKTSSSTSSVGGEINPDGTLVGVRSGGNPLFLNRKSSDGSIALFQKDGGTVGSIGAKFSGRMYIAAGSSANTGLRMDTNFIAPCDASGANRDAAINIGSSGARFSNGYFVQVYASYFSGLNDTNTLIEFPGSDAIKFVTGGGEKARFISSGNFLQGKASENIGLAGNEFGKSGYIQATRSGSTCLYLNRITNTGTIALFQQAGNTKGEIFVTSAGTTYATTSDIRLKQDIEPLVATDKLMAMNPVSYAWKADPDGPRSMGFIANEMIEVMPEAVSTGEDDDAMMSMDYGRITPILVSALQDAHRKIEQLEQRLADTEAN